MNRLVRLLSSSSPAAAALTVTVCLALLPGDAAALATPVVPTPGSASLGDPYFPTEGNGGYDARHYQVVLTYRPKNHGLDATVTMTASAKADLSTFDLDFRGPHVLSAAVDHAPARAVRAGPKLVITPAVPIGAGSVFTTTVHYAGVPKTVVTRDLGRYGWVRSRDGALVVAEPDGAPTWMPVNDHPSDKATYAFRVTVPAGLQVVGNGTEGPVTSTRRTTTYRWRETAPMASYLASIAIGHFRFRRGRAGRIPVVVAVDPKFATSAAHLYRSTVTAVRWESKIFGRYPFPTVGGIVDDPRLDYALETQERPVYAGFAPNDDFVVHELAHQWFGDSVSLRSWRDIWLNEGLATYAEWLWHAHTGGESTRTAFQRYYLQPANSAALTPPPGDPGRGRLFAFSVYIRGAMCLEALRERVGSTTFFKILKTWAARHRHGNATAAQFESLAARLSHRRLGHLFDVWLDQPGKPTSW